MKKITTEDKNNGKKISKARKSSQKGMEKTSEKVREERNQRLIPDSTRGFLAEKDEPPFSMLKGEKMKKQFKVKRKKDFNYINPMNIYRMIDGRKYQFMGLYPNVNELKTDLERIHRKHGFVVKFEDLSSKKMKVWRRDR